MGVALLGLVFEIYEPPSQALLRPDNPWVAPLEVPLSSLTEPPLLPKP